MDYSARPFNGYERQQQHQQQQPDRLPGYNPEEHPNPYSLDFPSDLYHLGSNFPSAKPTDLSTFNPQPAFPSLPPQDRRPSYQSEFHPDDYNGVAAGTMPFPSQSVSGYNDRPPYPASDRYIQTQNSSSLGSHNDYRSGPPAPFRNDGDLPSFEDMSRFVPPSVNTDGPLPNTADDDPMARGKPGHPILGASGDLHSYLRPHLDQYVRTTNRLAFGERTVIVFSSKVAQKSYGSEKRFICPPPTAVLIGNSWWADGRKRGEDARLSPPRVVVSMSGEAAPPDTSIEWTGASGKSFDVNDPPGGTTYIGRCVGKQLFISDVDDKKKKVEALVKVSAPGPEDEPEKVIGVFPSRAIKVISKPSKKRQSAKNLELCINHGATIALFHRLRAQTVSTKYLCVSGSGSAFKGSDGAPLIGLEQRARVATPSFIARTTSWDPFVMYIVDITKPSGGVDAPPPPPPQPDYPSPPPNAIPFSTSGSSIPVHYNQTVVLQCLTSGVVSPVLVIRKVDHQTMAVGGGLQPRAKGVPHMFCAPGEVCGDPVSQLHKIAFEVYDANTAPDDVGGPGMTGAYLSCMGEKVNTYRPIEGRQWNAGAISPVPYGTERYPRSETSAPGSPSASEFPSNDGGRVKKKGAAGDAPKKGRRRAGSAGSTGRNNDAEGLSAANGATWQVDVGETSVWTVVGTDQVRYNFYIPPALFDQPHPPLGSFPVPSKPLTPFPAVNKYLSPEHMRDAPNGHSFSNGGSAAESQLNLYGENFNKDDPVNVYFGTEPSSHVEVRCPEVIGCNPPLDQSPTKRRPLLLVRDDGVVFPSSVFYP